LAVLAEEAGEASVKRLDGVVGKRLGAEGSVAGAADGGAAGDAGHVVEARNGLVMAGKGRRVDRVAVKDDVDVGARLQDVAMEAPLRRRPVAADIAAVEAH